MRSILVIALALAVPLSGCISVVPGYSFIGNPVTQEEHDEGAGLQVFFWRDVPDPPHEHFNPGALAANVLVTVVADGLLVTSLVGIALILRALENDHEDTEENTAPPQPRHHPQEPAPRQTMVARRDH
jgi:hypothetical protein